MTRVWELSDQMPGAVLLLDDGGRILHANAALAAALGEAAAALAGRSLVELSHPEDAAAVRACLSAGGAGPAEGAFRLRTREGAWRHFEGVAAPFTEPGTPARVVIEARDVTDRRRGEETLRGSDERTALAARGADDGIWDWDLEADRVEYSARWKAMVGADDQHVSDRPAEWFDRVHPEDVHGLRADIVAHLQGE